MTIRNKLQGREILGPDTAQLSVVPCNIDSDSTSKISRIVKSADAVISAVGYSPTFLIDPLGPFKIDYEATVKVIDACVDAKVPKFILVTSLLTNGLAAGQALNPQYLLLNAFGGTLLWKRQAELYLQVSDRV